MNEDMMNVNMMSVNSGITATRLQSDTEMISQKLRIASNDTVVE
jgi:hypothetical protein